MTYTAGRWKLRYNGYDYLLEDEQGGVYCREDRAIKLQDLLHLLAVIKDALE